MFPCFVGPRWVNALIDNDCLGCPVSGRNRRGRWWWPIMGPACYRLFGPRWTISWTCMDTVWLCCDPLPQIHYLTAARLLNPPRCSGMHGGGGRLGRKVRFEGARCHTELGLFVSTSVLSFLKVSRSSFSDSSICTAYTLCRAYTRHHGRKIPRR